MLEINVGSGGIAYNIGICSTSADDPLKTMPFSLQPVPGMNLKTDLLRPLQFQACFPTNPWLLKKITPVKGLRCQAFVRPVHHSH